MSSAPDSLSLKIKKYSEILSLVFFIFVLQMLQEHHIHESRSLKTFLVNLMCMTWRPFSMFMRVLPHLSVMFICLGDHIRGTHQSGGCVDAVLFILSAYVFFSG